MSEWQTIETAPKDGTQIFVWGSIEFSPHSRAHVGFEEMVQAEWEPGVESWQVSSVQADGWVPEPTHWMPLPSPPSD